jgi:uncharacterized protein YabE (DUF348 family)
MKLGPIVQRVRRVPLPWAAGALGFAGLVLLYLATAKTVQLVVDGQSVFLRTHAQTVAGAIRDAGYVASAADFADPDLSSRLSPGSVIHLERARQVILSVDGERWALESPLRIPSNILAQAGIPLYPGDRVWADGIPLADPSLSLGSPPDRLRVRRATEVSLSIDGRARALRSAAPTLGEALWEAGITLRAADPIAPAAEHPLGAPIDAVLRPARRVTILADGQELTAWASATTVGEALAQAGLAPTGLDYTLPAVDEPLPEDGHIRLVRVWDEIVIEQEPVPFETTYQPLPDLEIDHQRVIEPGAYGVVVNRVRVRIEDGEETGREVEGAFVAVEAQPRVVGYGTQIVLRTVATEDGALEYWRAVEMYATSYSPSRAGTSPDAPWYGMTASGQPLRKGLVAIDISLIPFGTRMYVPGYGYAEAADVGGGVRGRWIDLGYDDSNFVNWHQYVTVYFLTPVPPPGSIVWILP